MEQFRLYEALQVGSIPIIHRNGGEVEQHLPPEVLASPILFVDSWQEAMDSMVNLHNNPALLLKTQLKLVAWYRDYLQVRVTELEAAVRNKTLHHQ